MANYSLSSVGFRLQAAASLMRAHTGRAVRKFLIHPIDWDEIVIDSPGMIHIDQSAVSRTPMYCGTEVEITERAIRGMPLPIP